MPASITPQSATNTNRPSAKLATRRLIGVRMKSSAIGIMNNMIPNTTARMVGIHSFATDMVARPFDITARLAMTLAAEAGLSSKRTRSEEHTSELQSLMRISYAVFCLKKKKNKNKLTTTIDTILVSNKLYKEITYNLFILYNICT